MRILLVTETWDETTGPGETLYPFYQRILTELGHEVEAVDNKKNYLPFGGRTLWDTTPLYRRLRLQRLNHRLVNAKLRAAAERFRPELVLLTKCENITCDTVVWLQEKIRAVVFNWYHDNPFWAQNTSQHVLRSLPLYDAFGIWGKFFFPVLESVGCRRAEYLPMFYNEDRFPQDISPAAEPCEVAFIGFGSPERAAMLRHLTKFNLGLWGNWNLLAKDDPLRACVRGGLLNGREYARVLRSATIAVNVLNLSNRLGSNTRTFEATGMGRLLITEYTREQAEDLFVEDKEIVCFRNADDLREKVEYYLAHPTPREIIARAGQTRTLREHTLRHRLQRILAVTHELLDRRLRR